MLSYILILIKCPLQFRVSFIWPHPDLLGEQRPSAEPLKVIWPLKSRVAIKVIKIHLKLIEIPETLSLHNSFQTN